MGVEELGDVEKYRSDSALLHAASCTPIFTFLINLPGLTAVGGPCTAPGQAPAAPRAAPRPASAPRRANWDTKKSNFSHFHCFGSRPYHLEMMLAEASREISTDGSGMSDRVA